MNKITAAFRKLNGTVPIIFLTCLLLTIPTSAPARTASTVSNVFSNQGLLQGIVFVFGLGLLLNLTPCVYPMVPITLGYFGNRETESWTARVRDALLYLGGMALIYTILGAAAGLSGQVLGLALQNPFMQGTIALVMVLMAASMFGIFNLSFSENVQSELRTMADGLGTFGMGMTLGVAAAPCLAPSTVALLTYVGQTGSMFQGSLLFFVLSLGLGLPYVVLAIFSESTEFLPESGQWFEWVEILIGYLLVGVALYFLLPLLSERVLAGLVVVWLAAATYSLSVTAVPSDWLYWGLRTAAVVAIASIGAYWILFNYVWLPPKLEWTKGKKFIEKETIERPTMVYTGADWCVPCQEMKVTTFQNKRVVRAAQSVQLVKIDMTDPPPEDVGNWLSDHNLMGVPTMIFLKPGGEEIRKLRGQGYLNAQELSSRLNTLKQLTGVSFGPSSL